MLVRIILLFIIPHMTLSQSSLDSLIEVKIQSGEIIDVTSSQSGGGYTSLGKYDQGLVYGIDQKENRKRNRLQRVKKTGSVILITILILGVLTTLIYVIRKFRYLTKKFTLTLTLKKE